jgi:glucokinase
MILLGKRARNSAEDYRSFSVNTRSASGNLALTALTRGGVNIGGGIPPKLLWRIKEDTFMKRFTGKADLKD